MNRKKYQIPEMIFIRIPLGQALPLPLLQALLLPLPLPLSLSLVARNHPRRRGLPKDPVIYITYVFCVIFLAVPNRLLFFFL
jgi:hypothetical protein